jgi:murein DD-endopeptidase MepM/ murein hydrolase activator NlpD
VVFHKKHEEGQPDFDVAVVPYPRTVSIETASVEISREHPSLIGAFDAAGENVQLPFVLAEMFGGEIDFNTETQRGDRATVLFERIKREGEFVGYGDVQAATFEHGGKRFVGIRFIGPEGKPGWYDEHGRSLKREFLKSPLPFEPRITSQFTTHRLHPVYGDVRAHLGVDYAAPEGTRVVAVSAGTIESAGWSGDAGRLVVVRHKGGLETMYLHLSSIAEGIRAGAHVSQGQTLGRVGMTGAATGPHLDFRIRKDGKYSNPVAMRAKMPPGDPIGADQMDAFAKVRDSVLQQLKSRAAN